MKLNKTSQTAVIILVLCEMLFLIRAFILYSLYTNDEMYGDGQPEMDTYNRQLLKLIVYSFIVTIVLISCSLLIFKNTEKTKL